MIPGHIKEAACEHSLSISVFSILLTRVLFAQPSDDLETVSGELNGIEIEYVSNEYLIKPYTESDKYCVYLEVGEMTLMNKSIFAICISSLLLSTSQSNEWRWHRLAWEGNSVASVVSPPDSSQIMYVTLDDRWPLDDEGVYKSSDGGLTWLYLEQSYNPSCNILSIDQKNGATVFCGSGDDMDYYPKRSVDAGKHWMSLTNFVDRIVSSPWTEELILATGHVTTEWSLWISTDNGDSWTGIAGLESLELTDNIIFHHSIPDLVYAGYTEPTTGLARSWNNGASWQALYQGEVRSFDQDPRDGSHWIAMRIQYVGYSDTTYFAESHDNGETWEEWALPDSIQVARQMLFDLYDSKTIYISKFLSTSRGVYVSKDGGQSFESMNRGFTQDIRVYDVFRCRDKPGALLAATNSGLWYWTDGVPAESHGLTIPNRLRIESIFPNPFTNRVQVLVTGQNDDQLSGAIYTLNGAFLRRLNLVQETRETYGLVWDGLDSIGREASPGVYMLFIGKEQTGVSTRIVKFK